MQSTKNALVLILCLQFICIEMATAQRSVPLAALFSGAEQLAANGVDTTDISGIRAMADAADSPLNAYALLFLAQHNSAGVGAKIKSMFFSSVDKSQWARCWIYLVSLYALGDPDTYSFARSCLDSMIVYQNLGRSSSDADSYIQIIEILLHSGDYSRYAFFKSLFQRSPRPTAPYLMDFGTFAENPTLRDQAFSDLKPYLQDADEAYRWYAVNALIWFGNYPERRDLLREVALKDGSAKVRDLAIDYLVDYQDLPTIIKASEGLATKFADSTYTNLAIFRLAGLNSPSAFEALGRVKNALPSGRFRDQAAILLEMYIPPTPPKGQPVAVCVDSLVSLQEQVVALGWLADQAFVTSLSGKLQIALNALSNMDSVSGARAIKAYQVSVDVVYRDSLNPDPRRVTVEGWKFLYYNAQYILDRLPAIPPSPVITSLNPATAYGGGNGFSLIAKGKAFVPSSAVLWNGSSRTTSFVTDSILQATILASDIAAAGTASVAVLNPGNDTSNVMSFTIAQPPSGLSVKLVNSAGTNLTGGSLQYYDGSWKDAVNNNDGTFRVNTTLKTVSLRMTYEGGSQTKSNVAVGPNVVVFQTVNTQVKLQNSQGALIDTGTVQYYYSSWKTLGQTINGVANKELLPANYTFRMNYATASNDKQQDIGTNSTVVFSTVSAAVQLKNSQGSFIDQGSVQYYFSSWQTLGSTSNGVVAKELLPANYTFQMSYASATNDKQQNIGTNPIVVFNTVNATVQLKNSLGAFIDQGTVQYYFSSWQNLGTTTSGVATKELLPGNYTFRMTYASATNDKQQNIGTNPTVVFTTVNATVQLKNSQGSLIDQGTVQYYFSSWKTLGSTMNGVAMKELLPASYTFRMAYETVTNDKVQNISTNSTVSFSTVLCTVRVKNAQGQPVDGAQVSYYFSSWRPMGATVGGQVTKELLPANLTFRETIGSATQNKVQNIGTNALVEFVTQ